MVNVKDLAKKGEDARFLMHVRRSAHVPVHWRTAPSVSGMDRVGRNNGACGGAISRGTPLPLVGSMFYSHKILQQNRLIKLA